jgi:hypothetical protein
MNQQPPSPAQRAILQALADGAIITDTFYPARQYARARLHTPDGQQTVQGRIFDVLRRHRWIVIDPPNCERPHTTAYKLSEEGKRLANDGR